MYRSSPSSPAITSADMVLPVPESPANRAATPIPRPPPGRIRHSVSTCSRCRARAASSCSCAETASVSTRSVQPTAGSMRRASRSRPAAFCARAPAWSRPRSTGRSSRVAVSCAHRTARPICPGPRCRWSGTGVVSPRAVVHSRSRSVGASRGDSAVSGTSRLHAGSQLTSPASSTGTESTSRDPGCGSAGPGGWEASSERDASRRRASAAPSVSASTGSATIPHPRSSASRPATRTSSSGAGRDASRCRSRPRTPRPAACSAAAAVAVPVRRPWSRR